MKHNKLIAVGLILTIGVFLAAGCIGGGGGPAVISGPEITHCGVINQSGTYRLTKDIQTTKPDHPCLDIRASNVKIKGQDHTIKGMEESYFHNPPKEGKLPGAGIEISKPSEPKTTLQNLTVQNLKVKGFSIGIAISSTNSLIRNNQITYSAVGIIAYISNTTLIGNKVSTKVGTGVVIEGDNSRVEENKIKENKLSGIVIKGSNNSIDKNTICNNGKESKELYDLGVASSKEISEGKKELFTGNTGSNTCDTLEVKGNNSVSCDNPCP